MPQNMMFITTSNKLTRIINFTQHKNTESSFSERKPAPPGSTRPENGSQGDQAHPTTNRNKFAFYFGIRSENYQ
jgi:hypothetical protein